MSGEVVILPADNWVRQEYGLGIGDEWVGVNGGVGRYGRSSLVWADDFHSNLGPNNTESNMKTTSVTHQWSVAWSWLSGQLFWHTV